MSTVSKVKSVQGDGTWESKFGLMYSFIYEMEDGTVIKANHQKPENKQPVGQIVQYTIKGQDKHGQNYGSVGLNESMPYGQQLRAKESLEKGTKNDYTKGIEVGHAINNAVSLICAGVDLSIPETKTNEEKIYYTAQQILKIANRLKSE